MKLMYHLSSLAQRIEKITMIGTLNFVEKLTINNNILHMII